MKKETVERLRDISLLGVIGVIILFLSFALAEYPVLEEILKWVGVALLFIGIGATFILALTGKF
ncbi:MAG TPA: hypothetical protein ENF38_01490 [Candidatus Aenigmarchaeota archaeon]|nr:hypothetical protein [Candidatus Aenigmarchaeota archaeon]